MSMIHQINCGTWARVEDCLTPLPRQTKDSKILHFLPVVVYLPIGLITLSCDTVFKIFSFVGQIFYRDKRDPNQDFSAVCDDSRKWAQIKNLKDVRFDRNFLFGTATCTFQDSGAVNCPNSQWADWEKKCLPENNRSGKSADLFTLYQTRKGRTEIADRLKTLGANSYRFSIEWSQIQPTKDQFDETKLQIYVNFCKYLRDQGITPMVTLHHFSEPQWFHALGGFEKEENITYFIQFAEKVFPSLTKSYGWISPKPLVEHICTINEPAIDAFSRYIRGAFSPGNYFRFAKAGQFLLNALKAHCIAYEKLKKMNPNVQIGIVHQRLSMIGTNVMTGLATRYINRLVNETVLNFFKTKTFSYQMPFSCHLHEEGLNPQTDFVGLQYYTRPVISLTGSTSYHESMTQMPFREDPEGLYEAIVETHEAFKKPIIVTENGISTHDEKQRSRYMERALYAALRAKEKIGSENLRGYYTWSFCDNSEWDMGLHPQEFGTFGLSSDGKLNAKPKIGLQPFTAVVKASKEPNRAMA